MATWTEDTQQVELTPKVTTDMVIFLATNIGTVTTGEYADSNIVTTGANLVFYITRDGKRVGTVEYPMQELFAAALVALDKATE